MPTDQELLQQQILSTEQERENLSRRLAQEQNRSERVAIARDIDDLNRRLTILRASNSPEEAQRTYSISSAQAELARSGQRKRQELQEEIKRINATRDPRFPPLTEESYLKQKAIQEAGLRTYNASRPLIPETPESVAKREAVKQSAKQNYNREKMSSKQNDNYFLRTENGRLVLDPNVARSKQGGIFFKNKAEAEASGYQFDENAGFGKMEYTEEGRAVSLAEKVVGIRDEDVADGSERVTFVSAEALKNQSQVQELKDFFMGSEKSQFEDYSRREYERTTPFSVLVESGNYPAVVRKFANEVVGGNLIKLSNKILGRDLSQSQKIQAQEIVGETLLFSSLGSVTPTRAQIAKQLMPEKVFFYGAQSRQGNILQTDIAFLTRSGQKGVARGMSEIVGEKAGNQVIKTETQGFFVKRGINFPSGKTELRYGKKFVGADVSLSKSGLFEDYSISVQGSIGATGKLSRAKKIKDIEKFLGLSVGVEKNNRIAIISRAFSKKGEVISRGIIERIEPVDDSISYISSRGSLKSQKALSQTINAVSNTLQKPSQPLNVFPIISTKSSPLSTQPSVKAQTKVQSISIQTKNPVMQKQNLKVVLSTKQKPNQVSFLSYASASKYRQKNIQIPTQVTNQVSKEGTKTLQKNLSLERTMQKQKQVLRLKEKNIQSNRYFNINLNISPKYKRSGGSSFYLPKYQQKINTPPNFAVAVKRKGKFRPVYVGDLSKGISIAQNIVGNTVARSYKIIPLGKVNQAIRTPKGFYQSKKSPLTFIESRKLAINTIGEIGGLRSARRSRRRR